MSLTIERFVTTGFGWMKHARQGPASNSQKCYRNHITHFETFLEARNKTAQDGTVVDQDILDYIELLKSRYQQNTIAVKIAVIKSYFKWLKTQGLTHLPMIQSQRQVKITHKEVNCADLTAIREHLTGDSVRIKRDLAAFSLIVHCGFKSTEVASINADDIDFDNAEITIKKQKRSFRAAFHEIKAYADSKLQQGFYWKGYYLKRADDTKEPFFLNKYHQRISSRSLRRRLMGKVSKSYNIRDLRHTYLGNPNKVVKTELLNLEQINTTH